MWRRRRPHQAAPIPPPAALGWPSSSTTEQKAYFTGSLQLLADSEEPWATACCFTLTAAGVWTYTLNNANSAVQALNVGHMLTDSFTVTTIDGTAQVVTVTITGSNDAAIISGTATGSVIEADTGLSPGTPTASGTLTDTDVDNAANAFAAVTSPTASAGGYGTFTMTAAGVWTYTLNNTNSAVQALNAGNTLTDTFTVTTIDGTAKVVTVTITGHNDAAIISGTTSGTAIEAGGGQRHARRGDRDRNADGHRR